MRIAIAASAVAMLLTSCASDASTTEALRTRCEITADVIESWDQWASGAIDGEEFAASLRPLQRELAATLPRPSTDQVYTALGRLRLRADANGAPVATIDDAAPLFGEFFAADREVCPRATTTTDRP